MRALTQGVPAALRAMRIRAHLSKSSLDLLASLPSLCLFTLQTRGEGGVIAWRFRHACPTLHPCAAPLRPTRTPSGGHCACPQTARARAGTAPPLAASRREDGALGATAAGPQPDPGASDADWGTPWADEVLPDQIAAMKAAQLGGPGRALLAVQAPAEAPLDATAVTAPSPQRRRRRRGRRRSGGSRRRPAAARPSSRARPTARRQTL